MSDAHAEKLTDDGTCIDCGYEPARCRCAYRVGHTYTFANQSNSYFMGNDVRVTRDSDGESIVINGKDGMVAVRVKNHDFFISPREAELHALAEDLNRANASCTLDGQDYTDLLYDRARESWWEGANWLASEAGFERVYSAGRSGGWCCIAGTNADRMANVIMDPQDDADMEERAEILELLFNLHASVGDGVAHFHDLIRDEHAELEARREANIIRGTE